MSTEPFIGEIKMLGFNFAPRGYALCAGQLMSISQNTALFSLLGTTYGGDGRTTFGLPNLNGRIPVGQGQGSGLSPYVIGQTGGSESVTILNSQMPAHNHLAQGITVQVPVSTGAGEEASPVNGFLATAASDFYASGPTAGQYLGAAQVGGSTAISGGNLPVPILQPYLAINYSIATEGIFPSRP